MTPPNDRNRVNRIIPPEGLRRTDLSRTGNRETSIPNVKDIMVTIAGKGANDIKARVSFFSEMVIGRNNKEKVTTGWLYKKGIAESMNYLVLKITDEKLYRALPKSSSPHSAQYILNHYRSLDQLITPTSVTTATTATTIGAVGPRQNGKSTGYEHEIISVDSSVLKQKLARLQRRTNTTNGKIVIDLPFTASTLFTAPASTSFMMFIVVPFLDMSSSPTMNKVSAGFPAYKSVIQGGLAVMDPLVQDLRVLDMLYYMPPIQPLWMTPKAASQAKTPRTAAQNNIGKPAWYQSDEVRTDNHTLHAKNAPIFIDFQLTRDLEKQVNFVFSLDMETLLSQISRGATLQHFDTTQEQLLRGFQIKQLSIFRNSPDEEPHLVATFSDLIGRNTEIMETEGVNGVRQQIGGIKETRRNTETTKIRMFSGTDYEAATKTAGTYTYSFKIEVTDPLAPVLEPKYRQLNEIDDVFTSFYDRTTQKGMFNKEQGRYSSTAEEVYRSDQQKITNALLAHVEVLNMFSSNPINVTKMSQLLNISCTTPANMSKLIEFNRQLLTRVGQILGKNNAGQNKKFLKGDLVATNVEGSRGSRTIVREKWFKEDKISLNAPKNFGRKYMDVSTKNVGPSTVSLSTLTALTPPLVAQSTRGPSTTIPGSFLLPQAIPLGPGSLQQELGENPIPPSLNIDIALIKEDSKVATKIRSVENIGTNDNTATLKLIEWGSKNSITVDNIYQYDSKREADEYVSVLDETTDMTGSLNYGDQLQLDAALSRAKNKGKNPHIVLQKLFDNYNPRKQASEQMKPVVIEKFVRYATVAGDLQKAKKAIYKQVSSPMELIPGDLCRLRPLVDKKAGIFDDPFDKNMQIDTVFTVED